MACKYKYNNTWYSKEELKSILLKERGILPDGKLVKPEIKKTEIKTVYDVRTKYALQEKGFNSEKEAREYINNLNKQYNYSQEDYDDFRIVSRELSGKQPTQTRENTTSIENVKSKVLKKDIISHEVINKDRIRWLEKNSIDGKYEEDSKNKWEKIEGRWYKVGEFGQNETLPSYTSQAETNLKIAALKEVARKYPRSLITSRVVPINPNMVDNSERQYSKVGSQETQNPNNVNYQLKAVDILSTDKAKQVFAKGKKNGWDLNKILTELQVPKEQKQIILDKNLDIKIAGKKLSIVAERRKLATKWDLENSQLIKDIRVDKSQPKDLKPNAADNNLAAIMLYGMKMSELKDKGLPEEMNEANTLAYRILNDFMFDIKELEFYEDIILDNPEYATTLTTNENPVKEFFENDLFEESDKIEIDLREEIITSILFKSSSEQFYSEQSILTQLQEDLSNAFEDYKNTLLLPEGFNKKYPNIAKYIEKLFNFIKKNYLIGRSYITNKKSIDQLFYEVENNILGRDFIGRRKKSVRDTFQKALDSLEKPDFKISDWSTAETYKFADFLSTDIFTRFLQSTYGRNNMSEVMAVNKQLSPALLFKQFRNDLKTTLDTYKQQIVDREGLDETSEEYKILDGLLKDIYNQYTGETPNTDFAFIVNKRLEKRFIKGGKYDDITEEDVVAQQNENENEVKDTSEENQLESWQTKQGKIDAKTKSSARLREFFSSFPLRTRLIKNGKSERTTITDMDLYNKLYYKGEYIHNKLLVELSDNSVYTDFITAINNLVPKYQFAGDLLGVIMNLSEEQLMEAYDNGTLELPLDLLENQDNYPSYNMWILKDMYEAIADQTNLNPLKTLTTSQDKQVKTTKVVKSVKNTDFENAVRSLKETLDNKFSNPVKKAELKDLLETTIAAIDSEGKVAGLITEVFSEIGYEASNELLLNLQPSVSLNGVEDNLSYLKKALVSILNDINENKSEVDPTGRIEFIARLISTYSTISSGLSYMNVENENEFAHKNSNYLTRIQAIWNKGQERKNQWVNSMRMYNGQPILSHYRNPFYTDFLNKNSDYRIIADGFIQVEGQSNSGKAYADYNKSEILASSINAFLAKYNDAIESNTIKKGGKHALYHIQVYSDSPQRWFLHAPVFSKKDIVEKLAQITYGEMERIFYTKQGSLKQFEKLKKAGSMFQNIPELNDVQFLTEAGNLISFADVFNIESWQDFSGTAIIPGLKGIMYKSKADGTMIAENLPSSNYKSLLEKTIEKVLDDNTANFFEYLSKEDVYTMIPEVAQGIEDVTGKIKEKDLKDFYYNTFYNNIVSQNVFGGDPANYNTNPESYKTDIDIVKRTKQQISPNILKVFKRPNFNVIILKDIELETPYFQKEGKNVKANTTDAGAYHTLARRREIMEAEPNWDLIKNDVIPIFDRIQNGTYTREDLETLDLQPLKPFVYTQIIQNIDTKRPDGTPGTAAIRVPIQLKDSEHVLLPTEAFLVEGEERYVRPTSLADITNGKYIRPDLAKLLYLMETQHVDLAVFESGSKAEIFNKVDMDSADEATVTRSKVSLKNSDWGKQQEIPRKDMEAKVGQGSQEHKIMSANVDPDWSFNYNGKTYSGQEGANELLQSIQERNAEANLKKALKKITDKDGNINVDKVLDILKEGIIEKNSNLELLEGLKRQADGKTLIPVELLGKKGQQVLNSILKKVSTFKVKGAALVNKPGFGYMGNRNNPNSFSDDLQLITEKLENGSVIIKYWEAIVPVYDPIIYDYIDINGNLLLDENNNPLIPEKLLQAFFYRIPTEDKYSMFPIRIKKFSMPAQGGGIILPREATETAGLDFDVDKLYGYYYNFKVKTEPAELNSFKKYVLQDTNDRDLKSKYIDAIYGGYIENIEMLQEKGLSEDDIPFIKKYSVSLRRYEKQYKIDNPNTVFNKKVIIHESSLDTAEGTQNLKLDVYLSLTNTKAYGRDALKPGNKKRLTKLRDKVIANANISNYSYADPVHITNNAAKNTVGRRLIGIFANANAFYNLIQGVVKLNLKSKLTFVVGNRTYNFTSLANINPQISKNISELLFASTEDVKNPVLELLNINEITSSLLITMLSLTANNGKDIIEFEDAIAILSDPSIVKAVRKVQKEGGRLKDVYEGQYEKLINISDAYNSIISASKIDQEIGPDFYTVQSKLDSIDSIIEASTNKFYPLVHSDVMKILPTSSLQSDIKQLNIYRKALEKEISMFSGVYSFLQPTTQNILSNLRSISKNKKLRPSDMQKYSYMIYDAAIQGYLNSKGKLQDIKENFPKKLASYTFPKDSTILQQAFEVKNKRVKMRWVNISASDILTQYQNAFADLSASDPEFANDLATYAFLTGTNFSMDSIVKIVPNVYYNTTEGQVIRDIINGNQLSNALSNLSNPFISVLFNNFTPILKELKDFTFTDGVYTSNAGPMNDEYVYIREKTGNILLKQTAEGDYYPIHRQEKNALPNYIINTAIEINKTGGDISDIIDDLSYYMNKNLLKNLGDKENNGTIITDDSEPDINNDNIIECSE